MADINELSVRKIITVQLITTLCVSFILSLISVLFFKDTVEVLGIRKEIFMFIAGAFTGSVSTAMALYFNRNDRTNDNTKIL